MEGEQGATEKEADYKAEIVTASRVETESIRPAEFVKVEKNLASLGFFTPSSKRLRNAKEKSFTITTVADGTRLELKGTIIPSAKYGLPITADQDKWIALCKILNDIVQKEGKVTNPVSFTSAEILRLLHKHRHSGKNYKEVEEWLDVLFSTTIFSEGVVYLAGEKRRGKDRFRVFDRAVSLGKELPDGKVADKNYVWFSDWQLQNINTNHLLPIDLDAYRELKNHISKALVPLLQVWLYATRQEGIFEKRYDELCQFLNIQQYHYPSLIRRTLAPSLDELKLMGYLADWEVLKTSDGENYKIIFYHGEKFHRDHRARLSRKRTTVLAGDKLSATPPSPGQERHRRADRPGPTLNPTVFAEYFAELMKRGITETRARALLADISPDQQVIAQLEWGDLQVQQAHGKITNPAGFYISLVTGNVLPPTSFETSYHRKAREEEERRRDELRRAHEELETEYEWYRDNEIERFIGALDPAEVTAVREAKRQEMEAQHKSPWIIDSFTEHGTRRELTKRVPLMTIEEFKASREQGTVLPSQPDSLPASGESTIPEPVPISPRLEQGPIDEVPPMTATDSPLLGAERGAPITESPEPAAQLARPESAIELLSKPPEPEPRPDLPEPEDGLPSAQCSVEQTPLT